MNDLLIFTVLLLQPLIIDVATVVTGLLLVIAFVSEAYKFIVSIF